MKVETAENALARKGFFSAHLEQKKTRYIASAVGASGKKLGFYNLTHSKRASLACKQPVVHNMHTSDHPLDLHRKLTTPWRKKYHPLKIFRPPPETKTTPKGGGSDTYA